MGRSEPPYGAVRAALPSGCSRGLGPASDRDPRATSRSGAIARCPSRSIRAIRRYPPSAIIPCKVPAMCLGNAVPNVFRGCFSRRAEGFQNNPSEVAFINENNKNEIDSFRCNFFDRKKKEGANCRSRNCEANSEESTQRKRAHLRLPLPWRPRWGDLLARLASHLCSLLAICFASPPFASRAPRFAKFRTALSSLCDLCPPCFASREPP